jgi:curli biogenesis system outer membrane secretion channel CsgG
MTFRPLKRLAAVFLIGGFMIKTLILLMVMLAHLLVKAQTVSVLKFQDKSGENGCREYWSYYQSWLGDGFKEMLITELVRIKNIEVLERETIKDIYSNEHELVNSEEDVLLKKKKFKKAKYSVSGAVTEFQFCATQNDKSVHIGAVAQLFGVSAPDISLKSKKWTSKIVINLRLVNNETGSVVKSVQAEGAADDSQFAVDSNFGDYKNTHESPVAHAAQKAIADATQKIASGIK